MSKKRNKKKAETIRKRLRAGSKETKEQLISKNPCCDICGMAGDNDSLQLHHIYFIRWGFTTHISRCSLLCPNCHYKYHRKFDLYLDNLYETNPNADFNAIYEETKKSIK